MPTLSHDLANEVAPLVSYSRRCYYYSLEETIKKKGQRRVWQVERCDTGLEYAQGERAAMSVSKLMKLHRTVEFQRSPQNPFGNSCPSQVIHDRPATSVPLNADTRSGTRHIAVEHLEKRHGLSFDQHTHTHTRVRVNRSSYMDVCKHVLPAVFRDHLANPHP